MRVPAPPLTRAPPELLLEGLTRPGPNVRPPFIAAGGAAVVIRVAAGTVAVPFCTKLWLALARFDTPRGTPIPAMFPLTTILDPLGLLARKLEVVGPRPTITVLRAVAAGGRGGT